MTDVLARDYPAPTRDDFLPFHQPDLTDSEILETVDALKSGWITTGPKTKAFERRFEEVVGASHAIAVNSCTAAMHLALEAVGLGSGDEVITTPYTFAATAEVVRYFDAKPVFVDIRPTDLNINPDLIEAAVSERTKAIIPVHVAGLSCEMDAIYAIAAKYGLAVIEDAAHAFPATYKGRSIGGDLELNTGFEFPHLTCFSFYATKTITTGEGGMICTKDADLAERCRIMALHGISKDAWKRYTAEGSWYYEIIAPGFKYNLTDVASAMGLAQLARADEMWRRRREIALRFNQAFEAAPELQNPDDRTDCQHAWHLFILRLNLDRLRTDRAQFIEELKRLNIGTSVHFIPLHLHPYYRETYGFEPDDYPVSLNQFQRAISLPIYSKMRGPDVDYVIESVLHVMSKWRI
jgi:dTDP-4-amino-4,6-dideoxygalactose transaminase